MSRAPMRKNEPAPSDKASVSGGSWILEPHEAVEREEDLAADEHTCGGKVKPAWSLSKMTIGVPLQRKCACGGLEGECEACREKAALQRRAADLATGSTVPPIVNEVLHSQGQPLDTASRKFFEPRFSHDLSAVRVHTDTRAGESARAVHAHAYTVGNDVVFAANRYSPDTTSGRTLIAHELSHVIQQSPGTGSLSLDLNAAEAEADKAANRVVSGQRAAVGRIMPRYLARQADDQPTSLSGSYDPSTKTYQQLLEELGKIQRWLESHPASSPDRTRLESVQTQIVETMRRLDKAMVRTSPMGVVDLRPFSKSPEQREETEKLSEKIAPHQYQPTPPTRSTPAKTESPLEKFTREHAKEIAQLPQWSEHFAQGMARSTLRAKFGEAWEQLKSDLTSAGRGAEFYMGLQVGVPIGAIKDVYDQMKAVAEVMIKAFILDRQLHTDPLKVWSELKKFAESLPSKLVQLFDADQLGFVAGEALAAKVDQQFVSKGAFDQGRAIGEIIGTILMEVALLFVGVEEVSAAVKAIRATTLGEEVAHGMSLTSRELKALLEAEGALKTQVEIVEGAAKEAESLREAQKGTATLEREGSEAASKITKLPEDLASCRLGSLTCPISQLSLKRKFQRHLRARPHEEYLGPLDKNLDLEIGKSLRQTENVLTGDAQRARYLREVHFSEWSHPFLEEMSRIDKLPANRSGTSFIEVNVNGTKRRWPVDNLGKPWEIHHEPPLDCGGTDASHFLRPVPFNVHSDATKWWNGLKKLALEEFPKEQRRLITAAEEVEALGL